MSDFTTVLPISGASKTQAVVLLTLLTPFSGVAFRAGAYIVPHTLTSILTRRTANS